VHSAQTQFHGFALLPRPSSGCLGHSSRGWKRLLKQSRSKPLNRTL
jgi:hypothetical protein